MRTVTIMLLALTLAACTESSQPPTATPTPKPPVFVVVTATPSPTPTITPTSTVTPTPTITPTSAVTPTPTITPTPTVTPAPFFGHWKRESLDRDEITGRTIDAIYVGASLIDDDSPSLGPRITPELGLRLGIAEALIVRCTRGSSIRFQNGLDVLIAWKEAVKVNDLGQAEVMTQFDDDPFIHGRWDVSDEGNSTFVPNIELAVRLLKRSSRLLVRTKNAEGNDIDAAWNVEGFSDSFRPLRENCPQ